LLGFLSIKLELEIDFDGVAETGVDLKVRIGLTAEASRIRTPGPIAIDLLPAILRIDLIYLACNSTVVHAGKRSGLPSARPGFA